METVEIVVYLSVAVIVGSLMIAFIAGWDAKGTYEGFKDLFGQGDVADYEQIPVEQMARVALEVWDACGLGTTNFTKTIYVTGSGTYDKTDLFTTVKQYDLCRSLQSSDFSCGTKEDVQFISTLAIPTVVSVRCENGKLVIE